MANTILTLEEFEDRCRKDAELLEKEMLDVLHPDWDLAYLPVCGVLVVLVENRWHRALVFPNGIDLVLGPIEWRNKNDK